MPDLHDSMIFIIQIKQFKKLLHTAILYRKMILDPVEPLMKLPIDVPAEDVIQKELLLLMEVLSEFEKMFPGEALKDRERGRAEPTERDKC